jgi:CRP-like cAMP-binding protein
VALFRQDAKVAALAKAPLFDGLSKKELTALARLTEDMEVDAGTVLCKEGEIGREFFVVMDGEVEVKRRGRRLKSTDGHFFGEIALLEDLPRTATVTAKTPLRIFVLTARDFRHVLDDHPSVERKVMRTLARRLADQVAHPSVA